MKILKRILLVNWYLFDAETIDVTGNLLVVGPTGSGKTSLLDAIQTVLLGGHGTHIKLNANATDKSGRNLRGYCLGLIRAEDKKNADAYQAREDAITHLALVFEDNESGEEITLGVCLSAKRSETKHRVEGLYILPQQALAMDAFLDNGSPISWKHLREEIKRNVKLHKKDEPYFYGSQPEKYIAQFCQSMSPDNRFIDSQKYIRSLQKAVNLQDVENVSDFVKWFILDNDPINIKRMKDSIKIYEELFESAQKTEEKITELSKINTAFQKAFTAQKYIIVYQWIQQEYLLQKKDLEKNKLEEELIQLCQCVKSAIRNIHSYEKEEKFHEKEKESLINLINNDDKEKKLNTLKNDKRIINNDIEKLNSRIKEFASILEDIADLVKYRDILPKEFSDLVQQLAKQLSKDPLPSLKLIEWPKNPSIFDTLVISLQEQTLLSKQQIKKYRDNLLIQKSDLEKDFIDQRDRLKNLKEGNSDLYPNTRKLIQELKDHNIEAIPVCDLVEVVNESWQPAIEAYLKSNMQALYVAPENTENAIRIYRSINKQKKIYGATVINTQKTQAWINQNIPKNSCGVFLTSNNQHALAYLQNLLRHVICVETEQDLMSERRAITQDGMLHRNGGITRMKLPSLFYLGKQARKNGINVLKEQISVLSSELVSIEKNFNTADAMQGHVSNATKNLDSITSFSQQIDAINKKKSQLEILQKLINDINLEHLETWKKQRDHHAEKIFKIRKQRDMARDKKIIARQEYKSKKELINQLEKDISVTANKRFNLENSHFFNIELATKHSEELELSDSDVNIIIEIAKKREITKNNIYKRHYQEAQEALIKYRYRFSQEIEKLKQDETENEAYQWVETSLQKLEETELANYKQQASDALNEAQIAFRSDIATRLKENIQKMKSLIAEINSNLRKHTFSGNEEYQFSYKKNLEYKKILEYIEKAEFLDLSHGGELFEDKSGIEDIMLAIKEDTESGEAKLNKLPIADYRNYYHYDIKIKDIKQQHEALLSKRMGTASGGEHRTPYYVAIGASLASAYRIESKEGMKIQGGMGLALLDEAFEKMDGHNSLQAANYLKELGLQLILAAPDEADGTCCGYGYFYYSRRYKY